MTTPREVSAMRSSGAACRPAAQTVIAFGETLVDQFRDRNVLGGAPFNVACHLGALGAHPVLVTRAGKDVLGEQLLQVMSERGLDLRGVQRDPARPTGRVKVTETSRGHAFDILSDQAYDHIHASLARMVGLSSHPQLVYFGTLSQRGDSRRALRELLGTVDAGAFLDVNLCDPWVDADTLRRSLQQASVVKLNEDELERIGALFALDGATQQARAAALVSGFALQRVVVTRGAAGAWTIDAAGRIESVAGTPLPGVVDTVGAGDGFAAVFMLGMLRRWPLAERLERADAFARALCGIRGAVPPTQDFYLPFIRDWRLETAAARA
ncbi:MAG: carbohydrate kinase family protein [Hyphomicrobiaceae bacterium]